MLVDEFEITYMLMNKLIDSKKILKTINDGIFSYYLNNNEEIPEISLDTIFKAVQRIESMAKKRLKSRINNESLF